MLPLRFNAPDCYELLDTMGAAGQSVVFSARDRRTGEQVAIKHSSRSQNGLAAGVGELAALLAVDHPNLVRCLDFHYLNDGSTLIVYEFIAGGSLRDRMQEGKSLPLATLIDCGRQLLEGLDHLHRRSLVHCDLKPENILVADLLERGEACRCYKIADLGIAFSRASADPSAPQRVVAGKGSPAYMAPEAFYQNATAASDLYSLGVILFELCVGARPFEGDIRSLARMHAHEPPPLERVPYPELLHLLSWLLEKDPRKRARSAGLALAALPGTGSCIIPSTFKENSSAEAPPPTAVALPWYPLEHYKQVASFTVRTFASGILPVLSGDKITLALRFETHLELLDGRTGQPLGCCIPLAYPTLQITGRGSLVTSDAEYIHRWHPERRQPGPLSRLGYGTRIASLSPDERRVLWIEGEHLFLRELPDGPVQALGRVDCGGVPPHLIAGVEREGWLFIPGTVQPVPEWIDFSGKRERGTALPGPVVEAAICNAPLALLSPLRGPSPGQLVLAVLSDVSAPVTHRFERIPDFHGFCERGFYFGIEGEPLSVIDLSGNRQTLGRMDLFGTPITFTPCRRYFYRTVRQGNQLSVELFQFKHA